MSEEPPIPSDEQAFCGAGDWPHAPPHRLDMSGVYIVTARFRDNVPHLQGPSRRDWFQEKLLELAIEFGWSMEAWAVLPNHYHFVAHSPEENAVSLAPMTRKLHSLATKEINRRDQKPGRTRLWHNYWETRITFPRSYLARLNYVHQNAVHHGLVDRASNYPWCSAAAFVKAASPAWVKTIASFRYDEIAEKDGD